MTDEKKELLAELKKLSKTANQRMVKLEKVTGLKESFGVKQLKDYLTNEKLNAWTKSGRIPVSARYNETELINIIKATKDFLSGEYGMTKMGEINKAKREVEKSIGKPISYSQLDTMYQVSELLKWIDDHYGSDFWKEYYPKAQSMSKENWVDYIANNYDEIVDETILNKFRLVYDYITKG